MHKICVFLRLVLYYYHLTLDSGWAMRARTHARRAARPPLTDRKESSGGSSGTEGALWGYEGEGGRLLVVGEISWTWGYVFGCSWHTLFVFSVQYRRGYRPEPSRTQRLSSRCRGGFVWGGCVRGYDAGGSVVNKRTCATGVDVLGERSVAHVFSHSEHQGSLLAVYACTHSRTLANVWTETHDRTFYTHVCVEERSC